MGEVEPVPAVEPPPKPTIDDTKNEWLDTVSQAREQAKRGEKLRLRVEELASQLADVQQQYDDWKAAASERDAVIAKIAEINDTLSQQLVDAAADVVKKEG